MRALGVKPSVRFESWCFFSFIERTFTEAAEQAPHPRAGPAQAAVD
jgi:hypothetical protein